MELMVALVVFSFLGIASHRVLSTLIEARGHESVHAARLAQVQKALWVMGQDLAQMKVQSLKIPDDAYAARFTRGGFSNPLSLPRSDVILVAYRLEGHRLTRYYWPQQAGGTAQQAQVLLPDVSRFSIRQVNGRSVEMVLDVPGLGEIRRVMETPDT